MSKSLLFLLTTLICCSIQAQNIGINATGATPDASALLDIAASDKGLLIPRVTLTGTTDVTTITSAATSLLVYNSATVSDVTPGYYYWNGTTWIRFLNTVGSSNDWAITGNSGTTAGTNFIGTTDAVDWVVKTNNTERARFKSTGNVGIGTTTPSNKVHIYEATNNANRSVLFVESNDPGTGGTIHNVAIMGKAIGSGNATDKYIGVLGYTNGGGFGSWRAHGVMGVVGDNAAADWTTYNPFDAPVNSTAAGITGYSTGNIIVQNTAGYFINDGTGFSTHKGVQIQNYATNATRYGIYLEVEDAGSATTSSSQYGMKMTVREGTNKNYGTRLDLDGNTNSDNWGEYFDISGTGTGTSYGSVIVLSGGATNYGAKYDVSSGTTSYGVYAQTTGGTNEYALYCTASASTDYAGYFNTGKVYVRDQLTVGTTTPIEKATIQGAIALDELGSAPGGTTGYGKLYVRSSNSDLYFQDDSGVEYNLLTAGSSSLWTDGGTNTYLTSTTDEVGIGTTAPTEKLDVNGNIKMSGTRSKLFFKGDAAAHRAGLGLHGLGGGASIYVLPTNNAGTYVNSTMYFGSTGAFTSSTVNVSVNGNLTCSGTLSKGGGTFKIDHPLAPKDKYLYHSFVESPDMMNIYNGNITTDANGNAIVEMPDYFETLNMDFRYQLTVIGTFSQAIVSEEISGNKFSIKTDQPNVKVSWLVTGIRNDPWANENRVIPEVEKETDKKGSYLHPTAYGEKTQ